MRHALKGRCQAIFTKNILYLSIFIFNTMSNYISCIEVSKCNIIEEVLSQFTKNQNVKFN